jgi:hypothetical protein
MLECPGRAVPSVPGAHPSLLSGVQLPATLLEERLHAPARWSGGFPATPPGNNAPQRERPVGIRCLSWRLAWTSSFVASLALTDGPLTLSRLFGGRLAFDILHKVFSEDVQFSPGVAPPREGRSVFPFPEAPQKTTILRERGRLELDGCHAACLDLILRCQPCSD